MVFTHQVPQTGQRTWYTTSSRDAQVLRYGQAVESRHGAFKENAQALCFITQLFERQTYVARRGCRIAWRKKDECCGALVT